MPDDSPTPLPSDPQRQASGTLLAYHYQLWQTVLAWLRLKPGEHLWVEQAEDFDITSADGATAVQVSHSPRKVTLRDAKVREAIFHCWQLQQQRTHTPMQFRYITRGEATVEAGEPFGAGICGLKLWSEAASDPEVARRLLDFLRAERSHFPTAFSGFLERASPTEAAKALFVPLVFELGCGDTSVIQEAVNVQLAMFAEQNGIMPAAAIRTRDAIFQQVGKIAGQAQERWLTTAHLHAALASAATVVARHGFEDFMREAVELAPSLRALAAMASGADTFLEAPLPPSPDCIARTAALAALRAKLRPGHIVFAQASTGMGKTTLAKALAASEPGIWQWMPLAGLRGEAVVQRLRALSAWLARETGTPHLILDDVDVSAAAHAGLSHAFAVLAVLLTQRGGKMLVTTQTPPSARMIEVCGSDSDPVFAVPRMGVQEIRDMARVLGCPEGETIEGWARLVRMRSQGHPQLARAVLLDAKARAWPPPSLLDQTADESVGHVRTEARRLVLALPDAEKELLLRLSLITGRFRREHALALGAEPPPLARPGEAFEPLIGAWVEPLAGATFRVSPLLAEAAGAVFAGERVQDLHIQIAKAFAQNTMSPQEGAQAFEHAWEARHVPALGGLVHSLFEQPRAVFDAMAPHVAWFVLEGTEDNAVLLPESSFASLLLRMFQARIAAENVPALAGRVFRAWRAEIERSEPVEARPGALYLLAIQALGHGEVILTAPETVEYLGMLFDLEASDPALRAMADEQMTHVPSDLARELRHESLAGLQAALAFNRCRSIAWLDAWLTAIEAAPPALRESILHAVRLNPWWCGMMVDAAWLDEERKPQPDWPRCLAVMERVRCFAAQWNVPPLTLAAVRAATVIRDEYQHDSASALREIDAFLATATAPHPRLLDARATVLFHLDDNPAAVAAWDELLADWQPEAAHDRYPAFAARTRAIALARMEDFRGAARGFADARRRLPAGDDTPQAAGLLADAGLCWWHAGEYASAFAALNEAAQAADTLPAGHGDLLAFRMRRMVGHIVMILHSRLTGWTVAGQVTPPPGAASDLSVPDALRDLPEGTFDYTWVLLDRVGNALGVEERIPAAIQTRLAQALHPPVSFLVVQTEIERACRLGHFTQLLALAERIEFAFLAGQALMKERATGQPASVPSPVAQWQRASDMSGERLFTAALVAACSHGNATEAITAWRGDAVARRWGVEFARWLDHAEALLARPLAEAAARIRDPEGLTATEGQLLAARVAADTEAAPPDSLRSQVQLVIAFVPGVWRTAIGHALAHLCERAWRRHAAHPALLNSPRLTIPALFTACDTPRLGIAKAAAILLAASEATGPRFGQPIREQLHKLAAENLPVFESVSPFPSSSQGS